MTDTPITFLALTTTGPSPEEDKVVEAAAVRATRDGAEEEFVRVANPGGLSPAALQVAGVGQAEVAGKQPPGTVLRQVTKFCGAGLVVVYDAEAFGAFLAAEGVAMPACLDARRLAQIARPMATDYTLSGIAADLGLEPVGRRAPEQARQVAAVWFSLIDELGKLPLAARHLICRVAEAAIDPLAPVLSEIAHRDFELTSDPEGGLRDFFADNGELLRRVQKNEEDEPTDEALPTDGICRMFQTSGAIGKLLEGYEQRPQQVEMVYAVCEALNEPRHLMVEAGTGTGKSMAYLVPAVAWACTNKDKVVISTNTRNLQEQLFHKDLPFLHELLPGRFEPALLKGRRNYLCVRRFMHVATHFEREMGDLNEIMALAPLAAWASQTESGDLAECNGLMLSSGAPAAVQAVTAGSDECAGRGCRFRSLCKVNRARALAQLADLIVVNHALLFAEIGLDSRVLPPHRCLVFDEAHNLEDVATEALATVVDVPTIFRITRFLFRAQRDGSGGGLLATVMYEADRNLPRAAQEPVKESCGRAMEAVQQVVDATRQFFDTLAAPFYELPPHVDRVLLEECRPSVGSGSETWDAAEALRETIRALGEKIEALCTQLEESSGWHRGRGGAGRRSARPDHAAARLLGRGRVRALAGGGQLRLLARARQPRALHLLLHPRRPAADRRLHPRLLPQGEALRHLHLRHAAGGRQLRLHAGAARRGRPGAGGGRLPVGRLALRLRAADDVRRHHLPARSGRPARPHLRRRAGVVPHRPAEDDARAGDGALHLLLAAWSRSTASCAIRWSVRASWCWRRGTAAAARPSRRCSARTCLRAAGHAELLGGRGHLGRDAELPGADQAALPRLHRPARARPHGVPARARPGPLLALHAAGGGGQLPPGRRPADPAAHGPGRGHRDGPAPGDEGLRPQLPGQPAGDATASSATGRPRWRRWASSWSETREERPAP